MFMESNEFPEMSKKKSFWLFMLGIAIFAVVLVLHLIPIMAA